MELEEEENGERGRAAGGRGEDNPAGEEAQRGEMRQGEGEAIPGPGQAPGWERSGGEEEKEEEEEIIPGLAGAPGGEGSVGVVLKPQSRIARVPYEHRGKAGGVGSSWRRIPIQCCYYYHDADCTTVWRHMSRSNSAIVVLSCPYLDANVDASCHLLQGVVTFSSAHTYY